MTRHVLSVLDVAERLQYLLELGEKVKTRPQDYQEALRGQALALIFEKSSTRTRVSFEVAMRQLGGSALYLSTRDLQLGRGETIADTARVLSRYVQAISYRAFSHQAMAELAANATIPVINALDDREHPCQILADLLTLYERWGDLSGRRLVWLGDGNNVCHSLMLGAALIGLDLVVAHPPQYAPEASFVTRCGQILNERTDDKGSLTLTNNPGEAMDGAQAVYTDVWVSMGDDDEKAERLRVLAPYQLSRSLLDLAEPDCVVLHCLPAHRGEEISADVLDGPQADPVWDQAENRLHAQKALLIDLLGSADG